MSAGRVPANYGNADFVVTNNRARFGTRKIAVTLYGPRGGAIGTVELSAKKALSFARELFVALMR